MEIPENEQLVSPWEISQKFHIHKNTIRRWVKAGYVTAYRLSEQTIRYRMSEFQERVDRLARERGEE